MNDERLGEYRHVKTNRKYVVSRFSTFSCSLHREFDGLETCHYWDKLTGECFTRLAVEFFDGRFVKE